MKPEYDFSKGERGRFFHADTRLHLPAHDDLPQTWAGPDEEPGEASLEAYTRTAPRRLLAGTRGRP